MVTFSNKGLDALRVAARTVPPERMLIETDSPYLSPQPVRGRPNQPAHLAWTCELLAATLGLSPDDLATLTTDNARRLFHLSETDLL
jgi:TatD DNase family protein